MAAESEVKKSNFPVIPTAHWWALRRKFQQSIPGVVTANYIASVLDMQEESARANILPGLRTTGILDKEGKPTELARRWRDDQQYAEVCEQIVNQCYPEDLRAAFPDPANDRDGVGRWFANHTGSGEAMVKKLTQFYLLLTDADPSKAVDNPTKTTDRAKATKPATTRREPVKKPNSREPEVQVHERASTARDQQHAGPSVHINLQVHISADASTDQIEQVFASMAKHIYSDKKKAAE